MNRLVRGIWLGTCVGLALGAAFASQAAPARDSALDLALAAFVERYP